MKLNNQVIIQKLGDTYVAYDNNHSVLHEFNEVGHFIIGGIEKGWRKDKIVGEIVSKFEITKDQASGDFEEFLVELEKKDLISL